MRNPILSPRAPEARSAPVADSASGLLLRRALSREDWASVRALRFAALTRDGDCTSAAMPMHADTYDGTPGSSTYLLVERGRAIGTTRASHAHAGRPFRLPAMEAFARDAEAQLGAARVVEASLSAIDPAADRMITLLRLFKAHLCLCATVQAEWLVAAVREAQMGFYRRVFDMEILTGASSVAGFAMPRVLMGLRYPERAPALLRRFPVLAPLGDELARFAAGGALRFGGEHGGAAEARSRARARDACA